MKVLFAVLTYLIVINLFAGNKLPVMLKVKSDFNISNKVVNTFRSGAEDSLTAQGYSLISKEQQEEALEQQAEQQKSDCYDDACLVTTGRMMAAQMIFIINISKMEKEYIFKARLVDLETGSTKRTVTQIYKGRLSSASDLLKFAKELTNEALGIKKEKTEVIATTILSPNTNVADLIKMEFYSTPKRAKVYIDGHFIGKTPAQAKITKGKHKFKLMLDDYEDYIFENEVYIDKRERINLKSKYIFVTLKTEPKNANIYLDKMLIKKSPATLKILKNKHKIEIYLKNYEKYFIEKEFNKNETISIKLKEKCNSNNADFCAVLGYKIFKKGDVKKGLKLLTNSCEFNSGYACSILAKLHETGIKVKKDVKKASQLYQKARIIYEKECSLNNSISCYHLGDFYNFGKGGNLNIKKSYGYYKKSCDLNNGNACNIIGIIYSEKKDYINAFNSYKKSCKLGFINGCDSLATLYMNGLGVKKDYSKVFELVKKTCEKGSGLGCLILGSMYHDGIFIKKNIYEANRFLGKSLSISQKECNLDLFLGCYTLASIYQNGFGVKADLSKAEKLYEKACKLGSVKSCEIIKKNKKRRKKRKKEKKEKKEREARRRAEERHRRIEFKKAEKRGLSNSWLSPMLVFHSDMIMPGFELLHVRWKYAQMGYLSMYGDISQYKVFGFNTISAGLKFFPDPSNRHKIGFTIGLGAEFGDKDESVVPIEVSYRYSHNMKLYAEIGFMTFLYTVEKKEDGEYGDTKYFNKYNFFIRIGFWGTMD